ncbi:MAG TPA: YkgJ family cysteine cluster protein [Bryobacteraceae bacterium]|nr:YkgJ family cysteine cluster protein [Bryobacteraceae bacterium]
MRFTCLPGCTACCRQPGFVYLSEADLTRAAAHLGVSPHEFEVEYVYRSRHRRRFRKPRGGTCPFLEETGCRLHPDKPTQCRTFPFWPEIIVDPATIDYCPGIGDGPLIRPEDIAGAEGEMRAAYPEMY